MDSVEKRAERAEASICLGEISTACPVLKASPMAPGTEATYRALTDARRTPLEPRDHPTYFESEPVHPFETDKETFFQNLSTARRERERQTLTTRDGSDSIRAERKNYLLSKTTVQSGLI